MTNITSQSIFDRNSRLNFKKYFSLWKKYKASLILYIIVYIKYIIQHWIKGYYIYNSNFLHSYMNFKQTYACHIYTFIKEGRIFIENSYTSFFGAVYDFVFQINTHYIHFVYVQLFVSCRVSWKSCITSCLVEIWLFQLTRHDTNSCTYILCI
jgi:hypothetical protein